ncbi:MAG: transporter substrate-binding domain-containing protein [Oscillospiraceae bacterium]|nr:transporter substrate-binding domain-containing protein [Oscillospiraceae bacterium]
MKRIISLVMTLVLCMAFILTGCGKSSEKANYKILDEAFATEEYAVGFRKSDVALCKAVEEALCELKQNGKISEIDKTWFGADVSTIDNAKIITLASSDSSLEKLKQKGTFILGLDDSFPPMGYNDNGEIKGYDIDLAKAVCEILGVELVLQPISWTAKENELNSGSIDCIWNGLSVNDERKEAMCMSLPYMNNRQVVVTLDNSGIKTPANLAGKKLVVQGGSTAVNALEANADIKATLKGGDAIQVDNNVLALFDLKNGGSDAVLMDEVVARYYITNPDKAEAAE